MTSRSKTIKRGFSIPANLSERLKQEKSVNWSRVVTDALKVKLGEIAKQRTQKTMQDTIDRLRATKIKAESEAYQQGVELAKIWETQTATAKDLEGAANLDDSFWCGEPPASFTYGEWIALSIRGVDSRDVDVSEITGDFFGIDSLDVRTELDDFDNVDFRAGFIDEVTRFWNEVKDQL